MAYTGKTDNINNDELKPKSGKMSNPLERRLHGSSERKTAVGYTLEPSVKRKVIRLAKKHGYRSASEFVNDVFKNW